MAAGNDRHGSFLITADGEIGLTGQPKYVYALHIISGATAAVVNLRNGTAVTDTIYIQETGSANLGKTVVFPGGFHFPAGCFVDVDANTTSVLVSADEARL